MDKERIECCFCHESVPVWQSHNPDPADTREESRCCDDCNWGIVLPARFAMGDIINRHVARKRGAAARAERVCEIV